MILCEYEDLYQDKDWINANVTQEFVYPPPRVLDLNETYPSGTQFQVEVTLRYWIDGHGEGGNAWADYNLDVKPYISLEACSWEYPETVTVPIPD